VSAMASAKRRQERKRGVRVNPENIIVEGADSYARTCRQHRSHLRPVRKDLPGALAHVEYLRKIMEQERPMGNHTMVGMDVERQGKTGVSRCRWPMGVGLFHSSVETHEGGKG
jgi:hypothetical protein